ncbi:MAG: 50S ribosomal protein L25 [Candidatus Marinimicrobia bacterium]|nr:50S ribosomal protein L25 [Candidatus Neomarinimicrobiota bacterium]|tara:strand:- start:1214 stop:1879 length:666 start_codon:yes stop_codon:yes gene_type:complete
MATEFKLELENRTEVGHQAAREVRNLGNVPGVFYSAKYEPVSFSIETRHLYEALHSQSHVYSVSVSGETLHAIFKEIQYHPVTEEIIHIDLFGISLTDKISLSVPVVLEGEPSGVKTGGIMSQNITEVEIQCLATKVPDAIRINVEELEVGNSIHVAELSIEDGEILTNPEITVVSVQIPKEEVIEEPVLEEDELAEGEEGAEEEGSESAEGVESKESESD